MLKKEWNNWLKIKTLKIELFAFNRMIIINITIIE